MSKHQAVRLMLRAMLAVHRILPSTTVRNLSISALAPCSISSLAEGTAIAVPSSLTQTSGTAEQALGSVFNNQFLSGGLTILLAGAAFAAARSLSDVLLEALQRQVTVRAQIDSRDDAYRWVMHWLSHHPSFREGTVFSISTSLMSFGTAPMENAGGNAPRKKVMWLPAPGDHVLRYQGAWVCISRKRQAGNAQAAANARLLMETIHINVLGGRNRRVVESLVKEAEEAYAASLRQRTAVHTVEQDGYWAQVGSRPMRPLNTVVLPPQQAEALLADCREFLESEEWYAHHGIPYRRGYLLHGPPGTGKTSLVMALAGELQLDIYVLTLSSPTMSDETLRSLLNSASPRSILLLEDVDAAFVQRQGEAAGRLTFSGLLNAIDGVTAQEGRLLFLTTNHPERLNPALIRPGRVDFRQQFHLATQQQAHDLFTSFYQDLPPAAAPMPKSAQAQQGQGPHAPHEKASALPIMAPGTLDSGASGLEAICPSIDQRQNAGLNLAQLTADVPLAVERQQLIAERLEESLEHPGRVDIAAEQHSSATEEEAGTPLPPPTGPPQPPTGPLQQAAPAEMSTSDTTALPHGAVPQTTHTQAGMVVRSQAELEALARQFSAAVPSDTVSMAQLQGFLMAHKRDPWGALADVWRLSKP